MTLAGYLEWFDGWQTVLVSLVIITGERTFQHGTRVADVDGFLHCDVAPVRHFNKAGQMGHSQKGVVVLIVNGDLILSEMEKFLSFNDKTVMKAQITIL